MKTEDSSEKEGNSDPRKLSYEELMTTNAIGMEKLEAYGVEWKSKFGDEDMTQNDDMMLPFEVIPYETDDRDEFNLVRRRKTNKPKYGKPDASGINVMYTFFHSYLTYLKILNMS